MWILVLGDLTTRRRCATSVCGSCGGTQAPGQRQRRAAAPADPLHIFALKTSLTGSTPLRQSSRSLARFPPDPALRGPTGALASAVGEVSHIISGQLPSPDRSFATGVGGTVAAFSWWVSLFSSLLWTHMEGRVVVYFSRFKEGKVHEDFIIFYLALGPLLKLV